MNKTKKLTKKIAEQFLADSNSVDLSKFTSIEDAAAEALAKHKGDLSFRGLTSLSDGAAKSLAKHKGRLNLSGLTSLSDATAESLAKHKGDICLEGNAKEVLIAARVRAVRLKTGTIIWNRAFLKSANKQYQETRVLKNRYPTFEILLNGAVSYGTSQANIAQWLEDNYISDDGGDEGCEMLAELIEVVGIQSFCSAAAAEAIAEAVVPEKKK